MKNKEDEVIKVVINISEGIMVEAKGHPAKVVAYGAAAGVVIVSGSVVYGGVKGGRLLWNQIKDKKSVKKLLEKF